MCPYLSHVYWSLSRRQSQNHAHTSLPTPVWNTQLFLHTLPLTHTLYVTLSLTHITVPLSHTHTFESSSRRQSQQSCTHLYRHRRAHKTSYSQTPTSRTFLVFFSLDFPLDFFCLQNKSNPRAQEPVLADADLTHFPGDFFSPPQTTPSQKSSHF